MSADEVVLSLREFAQYIDRSDGITRKHLRAGDVVGARKVPQEGSEKEVWQIPLLAAKEFKDALANGETGGERASKGSTLRVTGLTDETRAQLEAFVAARPGLKLEAGYWKPKAETKEQREAKTKARIARAEAALAAKLARANE